jgi:hypothetical protein
MMWLVRSASVAAMIVREPSALADLQACAHQRMVIHEQISRTALFDQVQRLGREYLLPRNRRRWAPNLLGHVQLRRLEIHVEDPLQAPPEAAAELQDADETGVLVSTYKSM